MKVKVELGGGLELLFNKQKTFEIDLPNGANTIETVVKEMEKKITEKQELFTNKDSKV